MTTHLDDAARHLDWTEAEAALFQALCNTDMPTTNAEQITDAIRAVIAESRPSSEPTAAAGGAPSDEELRSLYLSAAFPTGGAHGTVYSDGLRAVFEAGERAERERRAAAEAKRHHYSPKGGYCPGCNMRNCYAVAPPAPPPVAQAEKCPEPLPMYRGYFRCPSCYDGGACLPGGCGVPGCTRCGKVCPTCGGTCEVKATGTADPPEKGQGAEKCSRCEGDGYVNPGLHEKECPDCKGTGAANPYERFVAFVEENGGYDGRIDQLRRELSAGRDGGRA